MALLYKPLLLTILNAITLSIVDVILPGVVVLGGLWGYVVCALLIGLLNIFLKPILKVLALPFIFMTFGLFLVVINAFILFLTQFLLGVFAFGEIALLISGFLDYILAAVLFSIVHSFFGNFFR